MIIMKKQRIKDVPLGGIFNCKYDEFFTLSYADDSFFDYLGYTRQEFSELHQNHLINVIFKSERLDIINEIEAQVRADKVFMYENRLVCKDGSLKWVWISAELVSADKDPTFHCIFHDITKTKETLERSIINEKRYQIVLSQTQDVVFEQDCLTNEIYYSENFEKKYGYQVPVDDFPASMMREKIIYEEDQPELAKAFQSLRHGADHMVCEYRLKVRNQGYRWVEASASAIRDERDRLIKIVGIIKDIHDKKEAILQSQKKAALDPLTGLYNRKEFIRRLNSSLLQKDTLALILVDIDDFKTINDTFGHSKGDQTLLEVADGLQMIFSDDLVARFGGDEFILCVTDIRQQEDLKSKIQQLLSFFQKNVMTDMPLTISCSMGASIYPQHGDNFLTLFDKADIAMYQAKRNGKNQICTYNEKLDPFLQDSQRELKHTYHELIIEETMRVFSTYTKNEEAIPILLKKIEQFIDSDRISIYENGKKTFGCSRNELYHLENDMIDELYSSMILFEDTLIDYYDIEMIKDPKIKKWFKERKAQSAVLCTFVNENQDSMIICYEDCRKKREMLQETRQVIHLISLVIHLFLTRERKAQLTQKNVIAQLNRAKEQFPGYLLCSYAHDGFPFGFINQGLLHLLGYENEKEFKEAIHDYNINIIDPRDRASIKQQIRQQLIETGSYEVQYRMMKKDGSLLWVRESGKRLTTLTHKKVILSTFTDIADEMSYRHQFEIYQELYQNGVCICAMNEDLTLLYGNDRTYELLEIDTKERSSTIRCIRKIHPEDVQRVKKTIFKAFSDHDSSISLEFKINTEKGSVKWVRLLGIFAFTDEQWILKGLLQEFTKEMSVKKKVPHKEMMYRTALEQLQANVWEIDLNEDKLTLSRNDKGKFKDVIFDHVPQSLINQGYIHPNSIETIKEMHQKLKDGIPSIQRDVLFKDDTPDKWHWERIRCRTLFDAFNKPEIAVAVSKDVTKEKQAQRRYMQELQAQMIHNEDQIANFQCNLTKNHLDFINSKHIKDTQMTYDELLAFHSHLIANKEDAIRFENAMNRQALIKSFSNKETFRMIEFHRKDPEGKVCWYRAVAKIMIDAQGSDLLMTAILQDIEDNKKMEQLIEGKAVRDPLTQLYEAKTFESMSKAALNVMSPFSSCACILFQVEWADEVSKFHHQIDRLQSELATYLLISFSKDAIVGRTDANEFAVFLYGDISAEKIRQRTEKVRRFITYSFQMIMDEYCPIACGLTFEGQPTDFSELILKARDALQQAKSSKGSRSVCFQDSDLLPLTIKKEEERKLDTVLSKIASSFGFHAIHQALIEIQIYYGADRVILYSLLDDTETYETGTKNNEAVKMNRDRIDFQFLKEKTKQNGTHTWTKKEDLQKIIKVNDDLNESLESITAMSLYDNDLQTAILCMENPKLNTEKLFLYQVLGYVCGSELFKYSLLNDQASLRQKDSLTGVLNRDSFRRYKEDFREDMLYSLGVLSVDINGLKNFNDTYGSDQGDRLVCTLADLLKEAFSDHDIYRVSSDEFIVIMENISKEAMQDKLTSLNQKFAAFAYAASGSSWAEKQISLNNLIQSAEEKRFLDKQNYYSRAPRTDFSSRMSDTIQGLQTAFEKGYFHLYLQQKTDSRDEQVIGAKALVRYQDDSHGLITPGKFIPFLERMGLIQSVDLFMFEQVCRYLAQWKENEIPLIPISLNFSRITLLNEDLIEHMNQIADSLKIDHALIEVEITENMGDIERNTIITMCQKIKAAGYRLALDDFGANYSNISFLSDIAFDTLKFDKELIDDLVGNKNSRMILECIIELCKKLNIYIVTEGVETKEQVEILKELGCTYIQGYYYSRPVPASSYDFTKNRLETTQSEDVQI